MLLGVIFASSVPTVAEASTSWSLVASPNNGTHDNGLNDVSCVSATSCTAVSAYTTGNAINGNNVYQTLIESWNGTVWNLMPSPNTGVTDTLYGVSCVSTTSCMAVGSYGTGSQYDQTLIESWDGTT